jgi:HAD superfamily hydrolase (TIGR01549 family)
MDDTLFDHSLTCRAALQEVRRTEPRLATGPLNPQWRSYLERLDRTSRSLRWRSSPARSIEQARAERFRALAREAGWPCTQAEAQGLAALYREQYLRSRRPVPGAVDLVRTLARSVPIGIVTNNQLAEQQEKLEFLGLGDAVSHLVVSEAVGYGKPDPRIYRAALRAAGKTAGASVMVGDSWTNDVLGARAVGIRPVWFNRFGQPRPTRHRVEEISAFRPVRPVHRALRVRRMSRPAQSS